MAAEPPRIGDADRCAGSPQVRVDRLRVGGRGQGAPLTFTPPAYVLNRDDREETLTVAAPRGISAQADALVRDIAARLG